MAVPAIKTTSINDFCTVACHFSNSAAFWMTKNNKKKQTLCDLYKIRYWDADIHPPAHSTHPIPIVAAACWTSSHVHTLNRAVFWQLIVSRIAWSWQLIRSNHVGLILISPFLHLLCLSQFTRYQDVWCIDWSSTVRPSLYILPPPNFPPNSLVLVVAESFPCLLYAIDCPPLRGKLPGNSALITS